MVEWWDGSLDLVIPVVSIISIIDNPKDLN